MLAAKDVAKYFMSKDPEHNVFDKELVAMNGRTFYAGNARLNKYLHMAQNLHIALTGDKLFSEDLYAYDNGAVEPGVQENYSVLLNKDMRVAFDRETSTFLDKVYQAFQNAPLEELIELSHEDSEWQDKHTHIRKSEQRMDSLAHKDEYREQYADMLEVMRRMNP